MTKSELLEAAKEALLPRAGAEFSLSYLADGREIDYGTEPHNSVSAVSPGLKVTVVGEDTVVAQRRQQKIFLAPGVTYRNMLVIRHGETFIHILGDHIVVAGENLTVGQIAPGPKEEVGDGNVV